jgi:hypothetical protein
VMSLTIPSQLSRGWRDRRFAAVPNDWGTTPFGQALRQAIFT